MSMLKDNYDRIISEVEGRITNQEDLEFIKEKMSELSVMFMDVIDNFTSSTEDRIKRIENKQKLIEGKMNEVESFFDEMEAEIYEEIDEPNEEESYDFEIACPYCNNEFISDINGKNEVTCPNCNNSIELDWNDNEEEEQGCQGGCKGCHGCSIENNENIENEDDM